MISEFAKAATWTTKKEREEMLNPSGAVHPDSAASDGQYGRAANGAMPRHSTHACHIVQHSGTSEWHDATLSNTEGCANVAMLRQRTHACHVIQHTGLSGMA